MVSFNELDERVPFAKQLTEQRGPIVSVNTIHLAPEEVDAFLKALTADGELMKQQPGYVRGRQAAT